MYKVFQALTLVEQGAVAASFYGLPTLQLNTLADCCVYMSVHVAALFSKVISGTEKWKRNSKRNSNECFAIFTNLYVQD